MPITLVWFRYDLRMDDHAPLAAAARRGPVVPVYVWDPAAEMAPGPAARWWLHHGLTALDAALRRRHSRLVLRRGAPATELLACARACGADRVLYERCVAPPRAREEEAVAGVLEAAGVRAHGLPPNLLCGPEAVRSGRGAPYRVFTPYHRAASAVAPEAPLGPPARVSHPPRWPASLAPEALGLLPRVAWTGGLAETWAPGEAGARRRLARFLGGPVTRYARDRDRVDLEGTSRLGPALAFGALSVRRVHARALEVRREAAVEGRRGVDAFLRQLAWRDFTHAVAHHFPQTLTEPMQPKFARFPWRRDPAGLAAWQTGRTGYPIVDAAMRCLWREGWMHNRLRMVVASFLTKHLLVHWHAGATWFERTLVDADLCNNRFGWQWTAGSGADAAPYFRVFNPVRQGEKFDPAGRFVRRWVPELAGLPDRRLHAPWTATVAERREAGVGWDEAARRVRYAHEAADGVYPPPIVEHAVARDRALAAWEAL